MNAQSTDTGFCCYYQEGSKGDYRHFCFDVSLITGQATKVSSHAVSFEDWPFYWHSTGGAFDQMERATQGAALHYSTSYDEREPEWYCARGMEPAKGE